MSGVATSQAITFDREFVGDRWHVVMVIHGHGTMKMPLDAAHAFARQIMAQVNECERLERRVLRASGAARQ